MSNSTWLKEYEEEISEVKEKSGRAKYLKVEPIVESHMRRLATGGVEDRITAALEGEMKEKYIQTLSGEIRELLAKSLQGVKRWNREGVGQEIDPDFSENNLDHVEELLWWVREIEEKYPALKLAVTEGKFENWEDFYKMIIPHDNGEIVMGDMPRAHPEFNERKGKIHKRKEAWAGRRLFDFYLPPEQAEIFKALHSRWDRRAELDLLVNLGHVLDKGQASQNVAKHVVPFNEEKTFFAGTLEGVDAPMKYLERMQKMPKEARRELMALADDKIFRNWVQLEQNWVIAIVDEARFKLRKLMEG
ncbi:MAG: hypothetical protein ACRCZE_02670 [Candidatus Altimarinota bacterium]